ncbi:hypothetical protein GCM10011416_19710 [Polaribacter pacificus]|uniref:Uncharacterized protein n=1 Tax=Polaribacter pacificus TaxID=1775173 RepID=A0A917ME17_9FLAO|nr:hypothetical protein GCM10011416_19710 [Polaribacter pacificus]
MKPKNKQKLLKKNKEVESSKIIKNLNFGFCALKRDKRLNTKLNKVNQ